MAKTIQNLIVMDGRTEVVDVKTLNLLSKLIIDRKKAYHIGASLKDVGKKCFGINLIQDVKIIKDILQRLELETEESDEAV